MKHLTFLMLALFGAVQLSAQVEMNLTPNPKFGKPTSEELSMTTYAPDPTAAGPPRGAAAPVPAGAPVPFAGAALEDSIFFRLWAFAKEIRLTSVRMTIAAMIHNSSALIAYTSFPDPGPQASGSFLQYDHNPEALQFCFLILHFPQ